jgi:hypothetical protein
MADIVVFPHLYLSGRINAGAWEIIPRSELVLEDAEEESGYGRRS